MHDDGTVGVQDVDLDVQAGELVLLLGQVGSGKSSLLSALAGLVGSTGEIRWNDRLVDDPQTTLRPGRVAHVAQVPRVLSGTFTGNVALDHADRSVVPALEAARMGRDVAEAGGADAVVGHRGVRLSGGQVQRLALARALATDADVLLADDVSSALDAATEIELWQALRSRRHRRHRRHEQGGGARAGRPGRGARLRPRGRRRTVARAVVAVGPPGRLNRPRPLWPHGWVVTCASSSLVPRASSGPTCPTTCGCTGHEVTALVRRDAQLGPRVAVGPVLAGSSTKR